MRTKERKFLNENKILQKQEQRFKIDRNEDYKISKID